ncbi:ATP-dependent nuclease [Segatella paludivivens]|uniref:ATP-dependent nuclease n=1 Tax=Segatella paludivivens TaxID=185294 RepID=UPI00036B011A|nr:AAA family ATPase [Segatella paludivivens]
MNINNVHIRNFRKLKNCRIDFDKKQTLLVGANNSGKTSAISAIVWFLSGDNAKFSTREFTLTNWSEINKIGQNWVESDELNEEQLRPDFWDAFLPSLDVWLDVESTESYLVNHIIPSLAWDGKMVGCRARFEPKDIKTLYSDYKEACTKLAELKETEEWKKIHDSLELYPKDLYDFLSHRNNLQRYFNIKFYVLNSALIPTDNELSQKTPDLFLDENPIGKLIKIDYIGALRECSDSEGAKDNDIDTLSKQLQQYYRESNQDEDIPEATELKLVSELCLANKSYDEKLRQSFSSPIEELSNINYPGFQNPNIDVRGKIDIGQAISHESAVQFSLQGNDALSLPEKYNGMGYRNLISMYFRLIQFREKWLEPLHSSKGIIPCIHLVFVEEPEAHLHAQAQQVFIKKALDALTNNELIKDNNNLKTQLVISTHSNHIVNELDMNCLRYFRRIVDSIIKIPVSKIANLSGIFKGEDETRKFVTRYIRLTHCDIFFADAVILVEGAAEKMLMPKFLEDEGFDNYYIAIIEVNGSHAHRFKELIEKLGIYTLIVTDIDAMKKSVKENKEKWSSEITEKGKEQQTNNDSIKEWLGLADIDDLLALPPDNKIKSNVRIAYQTEIQIEWSDGNQYIVYPYTFEDALIFKNLDLFRGEKIKKMGPATTFYNDVKNAITPKELQQKIYNQLASTNCSKAEFANILLYEDVFEDLKTPDYIAEGLMWLSEKLKNKNE